MLNSGTALINPGKIFEKIQISVGARAADFGCGRTGHLIFFLAPLVGQKGVIYAVDIMKDVLDSIKSQAHTAGLDNVQTVWSDLETVGGAAIPEGSLDAGFFMNSFFLLKNREAALREAARLIKTDGYFAIIDWAKKVGPLGPAPGQMIDQNALAALAEKAGFKSFDKVDVGEYHFCRIFKKQ